MAAGWVCSCPHKHVPQAGRWRVSGRDLHAISICSPSVLHAWLLAFGVVRASESGSGAGAKGWLRPVSLLYLRAEGVVTVSLVPRRQQGAAGVAVAAVDCGGRVPALLGGQVFGFGQVGAEAGVLLLEGGDEPGSAFPPGLLSFGVCLGH